MATFTSRITGIVSETPRNRVVRLSLGNRLLAFDAGQHVLLGDHGQALRKPYSIACSPAQAARDRQLEFLIQVDTDESPGPHLARLEVGRLIDVEGPAGSFTLPPGPRPSAIALIGGGTGVAPLRAILWQVLTDSPETRISVLQSARTPAELSYADELRNLAGQARITLVETVTREAPSSWQGWRGRADAAMLSRLVGAAGTWCFVCGPDSLVEGIPKLLMAAGVEASHIRVEHWPDA